MGCAGINTMPLGDLRQLFGGADRPGVIVQGWPQYQPWVRLKPGTESVTKPVRMSGHTHFVIVDLWIMSKGVRAGEHMGVVWGE